ATAAAASHAGPSAASLLLPDEQKLSGDLLVPRAPGVGRLRRGSLHPTPRRSQRRSTPFFSSLLAPGSGLTRQFFEPRGARAARRDARSALQDRDRSRSFVGLDCDKEFEVDDMRPVDPHEAPGLETRLHVLKTRVDQVLPP